MESAKFNIVVDRRDGQPKRFTSKLGQLHLIRHRTPDSLRGSTCGVPVAVHTRLASAK